MTAMIATSSTLSSVSVVERARGSRGVSRGLTCLVLASQLIGCGSEAKPVALDEQTQPIIGGSNDTTYKAVVLLATENSVCTGTIVKVDATKKVGWVLTAAHCVLPNRPVVAILADDYAAADRKQFAVLDATSAPYTGQTAENSRDIAVVRILGVDASTPVIPLASAPDGAAVGATVVSVGYGRTTPSNQADAMLTKRKSISKRLSQIGTTFVRYSLSGGGICQGDSGGPVLLGSGSSARVIGVHSYVSNDCLGDGTSIRVTSELAFLNNELNKALPSLSTCKVCTDTNNSGDQVCAAKQTACTGDRDCAQLLDCLSKCGSSFACPAGCNEKFPRGIGPLAEAAQCTCRTACKTECGSDASCRNQPACGKTLRTDECGTCTTESCCAEHAAAYFDKDGNACIDKPDAAGCDSNAPYQAYQTCLRRSCATPCGLTPDPEAASSSSGQAAGSGDGTTTTTTETCGCGSRPGGPTNALLFAALVLPVLRRWSRPSRRSRGSRRSLS
jgi:secreted trypsin-like serine protease